MTIQNGLIKQLTARRMLAGLALLLPVCAACGENDVTCPGLRDAGIELSVFDSATNADLNQVARATVRTVGARIDSSQGSIYEAVFIASSKPGLYDVSVVAPGYVRQSRLVTVTETGSGCNRRLVTQRVTFRLLRSASATP